MLLVLQSDRQNLLVVLNGRHHAFQCNSCQQNQVEEVADKEGQTDMNRAGSCLYY